MNALNRVFLTASLIGGSLCIVLWGNGGPVQAAPGPIVQVGSEAITQASLNAAIAKYHSTEQVVLTKLVYISLIRQGAKKAKVWPSDQDVEQRIAEIRRRSPSLLAKVDADPSLMRDFKDNLHVDIALENLRIKNVSVTNKEISAFYEANKQAFTPPQQVQTTMVVTETKADADKAVGLLKSGMKDAVIARQPRMHVAGVAGYTIQMDRLTADEKKAISNAVFTTKAGEVKIVPVQGDFLIFKIKNNVTDATPSLSKIRPTVERALKLLKAPTTQYVLASLYQSTNPQFQSGKYESYFYDIEKYDIKAGAAAGKAAGH